MSATPLETRVLRVMAACRGLLPHEQLLEMEQLARAGEPGVALENLATQLCEYAAQLDNVTIAEIEALCRAMGLDDKYWARLTLRGMP